jgi:hypothetical protein
VRAILLGVLERPLAIPLGNEVERVRVGVLDAHAPERVVRLVQAECERF